MRAQRERPERLAQVPNVVLDEANGPQHPVLEAGCAGAQLGRLVGDGPRRSSGVEPAFPFYDVGPALELAELELGRNIVAGGDAVFVGQRGNGAEIPAQHVLFADVALDW